MQSRASLIGLLSEWVRSLHAEPGVPNWPSQRIGSLIACRCALEGFKPGVSDEADFDTEVACNPKGDMCEADQTCAYFESQPFNNMMSFDSVLMASVTLMQTSTWDTWETSMFALMDYTGSNLVRVPLMTSDDL